MFVHLCQLKATHKITGKLKGKRIDDPERRILEQRWSFFGPPDALVMSKQTTITEISFSKGKFGAKQESYWQGEHDR